MAFSYARDPSEEPPPPVAITSRPRARLPDLPGLELEYPPPNTNGKPRVASRVPSEVIVLDDDDEQDDDDEDMEMVEVLSEPRRAAFARAEETDTNINKDDEEQLAKLDLELRSVNQQISSLRQLSATIQADRSTLVRKMKARRQAAVPSVSAISKPKPSASAVDYTKSDFPWSIKVKQTLEKVWGIKSFRLCQEAAVAAVVDGRDVVAVLPTGAGKSLIYQLPALISPRGTTIVVTPLISLMDDQVYNLKAKGVSAEMIHASTTQEQSKDILRRMLGDSQVKGKGKGKGHARLENEGSEETPTLVFVTPERLEKSKTFMNTLQKMYDAGLLVRIVIDEAHCVSTQGHDYRSSYLALRRLKSLFPNTPILATTATAPASVIADMLKILAMPKQTSPGDAALPGTTVLFTSPLYRKNLHYSIVAKPNSPAAQVQAIVDYIEKEHIDDLGIIYCLTRADCENVAKGVNELSSRIKAAVYHAQLDNDVKLKVQDRWRRKQIKVVVATNASFGLGIDRPDVRYVIHHSLPKSLSSFYQESGRAGRDGASSDCLLFWRAADASRISTLIYESYHTGGKEMLFEMIQMCEDLRTCRKIAFSRSFAQASSTAFEAEGDEGVCGHCDNCLRDASTFESRDMSLLAYRALRIIAAAGQQNATLTLPQASDLVRGLGKGAFATQTQGGKGKGKGHVDVVAEAGGKVELDRDATEMLLIRLIVDGYLNERFHANAYSVISYIITSSRAARFTRLSPAEVESDGVPVELSMDVRVSGNKKRKATGPPVKKASKKSTAKRLAQDVLSTDDEEGVDGFYFRDQIADEDDDVIADEDEEEALMASGRVDEDEWETYPAR